MVIAERRGLALAQVLARPRQEEAVTARLGFDPAPGRASETPTGTALWLAPGTWMVVAQDVEDGGLYPRLREELGDLAAVVDQSHGRAVLRLAGPRARDVLAKGCRLDLHPRVFKPGCAPDRDRADRRPPASGGRTPDVRPLRVSRLRPGTSSNGSPRAPPSSATASTALIGQHVESALPDGFVAGSCGSICKIARRMLTDGATSPCVGRSPLS